jgi:coenzyme F420-0:L-glutamate ligase / coenzyme F420-1:gamma-L-glutamate ligase
VIVYPIASSLVEPGDSIIELFSNALSRNHVRIRTDDIVAVSSKIIAISEKRLRTLDTIRPTGKARTLGRRFSLSPAFAQAIIDEADTIVGGVKKTLLTIKNGEAVPNAGIDRKNAPEESVVLWPRSPDLSARILRSQIRKKHGKSVGVVIVDSRVSPLRLGTTGFAIGLAGIRPVEDLRGTRDLCGRQIEITFRAVADGIAAAAQLVMGETSELKPFAIIRGAPVKPDDDGTIREGRLARNRCLYMSQIPNRRTEKISKARGGTTTTQ